MLPDQLRFNFIDLWTRFGFSAARPISAGKPSWAMSLIRRVWRIVVAIRHRRELAQLSDQDDRMLADIGLTRGDLRAACCEPFWRDPTSVLAPRRNRFDPSTSVASESARCGIIVWRGDARVHRPVHTAVGRHLRSVS